MLNYFLLLFLIAYMIFRFSKPPPSIDDYKKKKEPDVYNIEKIYMISSICFVICTIFILIQPFLLFFIHTYFIAFPTVFFGIFNTVMTVLFKKYRDDIYFFESYNLIFTLLVTFIGMYSIYNPLDKQLFQMMSCPTDIPQETNHDNRRTPGVKYEAYFLSPSKHTAHHNNRRTIRTPGVDYDPHYVPEPRELASRGYRATDHVETDSGGNLITDPLDRLTLDRLRRGKHDLNPQETQEQLNAQNETLREKFDEFNPQLTRRNKFKSSRKDRIHPDTTAYNRAQNPVARKATVPSQVFDETGEMMSRHEQYKTPQISTFTSLHPIRGLSPQETDTFSSHDQEFFQNQFDHFRN